MSVVDHASCGHLRVLVDPVGFGCLVCELDRYATKIRQMRELLGSSPPVPQSSLPCGHLERYKTQMGTECFLCATRRAEGRVAQLEVELADYRAAYVREANEGKLEAKRRGLALAIEVVKDELSKLGGRWSLDSAYLYKALDRLEALKAEP